MNFRRILQIAALAILAAALIFVARTFKRTPPAPSSSIANYSMKQLDGRPIRLADYKGKVVLLDFWATWCSPCRQEIPYFVQWQAKYGDQGLQIIGVSMDDDTAAAEKFSREYKINYPIIKGDDALASQFGGILGLPVNIIIDRDGKIVARHDGLSDLADLEKELKGKLAAK